MLKLVTRDMPTNILSKLEEDQQLLADDIAMAFFNLTPDITEDADCGDVSHDAAAFFADAGIPKELFFGELQTNETGEGVIIVPHYWLEIPLRKTRIIVDLTLPYWLTDPASDTTDFDIPTVLIKRLSDERGRVYIGERIELPDQVGNADSSAISLHPQCQFCDGLVRHYHRLK